MKSQQMVFKKPIKKILAEVLYHQYPREMVMHHLLKKFYHQFVESDSGKNPQKVQEDKFYMARNLVWSIHRGLRRGQISHDVWRKFLRAVASLYLKENEKAKTFQEKYGFHPPGFVTVSPTKHCNLRCKGCYANSESHSREKLEYDTVSRIVTEVKEFWGAHFTVISGGEPLVYKSQGKDIFDFAQEHSDMFFLMYTNGTLIDKENARRFAEVGNITPAISVEGYEKETDDRRGKGVHKKIIQAFENLREFGVPFGISITATRQNVDTILSDEFIDYYFNQHGALYGWIFQYMPIGRSFTLDLMVTPKQRRNMYLKMWKLIREDGVFLADFWNCGTVSNGCISAGKPNGYFYIDWNGNVTPCVFNPYKTHNILDVYRKGGNLNTVLFSPFFKGIRQWQNQYTEDCPAHQMGNVIVPCAIKDHYEMMYNLIRETNAQPADEPAHQALQDPDYYRGMVKYGKELKEITDDIWESQYLQPERRKKISNTPEV